MHSRERLLVIIFSLQLIFSCWLIALGVKINFTVYACRVCSNVLNMCVQSVRVDMVHLPGEGVGERRVPVVIATSQQCDECFGGYTRPLWADSQTLS